MTGIDVRQLRSSDVAALRDLLRVFGGRARRVLRALTARSRADRQAEPGEPTMDSDLDAMSREQLIDEVRRLREGIRRHRDSSGQELCWHHPALWALLPEPSDPLPVVPAWPQFMAGCVRYRASLDAQAPAAPRRGEPHDDSDR